MSVLFLTLIGAFQALPYQRSLSVEAKAKAAKLLEMKANKIVQHKLSLETGNIILLKDLTNIAASLRGDTRNNLDATIGLLMNKHDKPTSIASRVCDL